MTKTPPSGDTFHAPEEVFSLAAQRLLESSDGLTAPEPAGALMPALDPQSLPQHTDRLFRAAWALCGSRQDAEDLVQETFARVLARPRSLRGQDELGYLMRVLRNTFLTQRRTASRRPQVAATTLDDLEPVDHSGARRPEQAVQMREVFATIAALSENYRLALIAVDIVGLSYREAADALGTREQTLAVRLFRAREQLAGELRGATPQSQKVDEKPVEERSGAKKESYSVVVRDGT
jgi:RNA polymerase sigma-70 factor (ECF subfamily)